MKSNLQEPEIERPLPASVEAERVILGAILMNNKAIEEAASLKPEDFSVQAHRLIFSSMLELAENHTPIELIPLMEELHRRGEMDGLAGGAGFISGLSDGMPKISNVGHYAKIVREKATFRRIIHLAHSIQESGFVAEDLEGVLDAMVERVIGLTMDSVTATDDVKTYRGAAVSLLKSFEEKSLLRVMSGIPGLDDLTGGFRGTELVTVTAGTGVGKTLFAQQTRRRACGDGLHTLYCSGEMTAEHLLSRELATEACVDHRLMRLPEHINKEEMASLMDAATHECEKCRILDGELNLQKIRLTARRLRRSKCGLDCVIVDYDELVDSPGRTEIDQQRNLIRGLKVLAVELAIPVIVISQLRKSMDKDDAKKPSLEKLYGSGAKSKHSSFVLFLDREYVRELTGNETDGRLCILKARDGRIAQIPLTFNVATLRFEDAPKFGDAPQQRFSPKTAKRLRDEKEGSEG